MHMASVDVGSLPTAHLSLLGASDILVYVRCHMHAYVPLRSSWSDICDKAPISLAGELGMTVGTLQGCHEHAGKKATPREGIPSRLISNASARPELNSQTRREQRTT